MTLEEILERMGGGAKRFLPSDGGREVRTIKARDLEVRAEDDDDERYLEGHGSVFNEWANIGGWFMERVAPGAFKKTISDGADVRMLFNHNPDLVLARTKSGTLELKEDSDGLFYRGSLNMDDPDAVRVLAKIERGDVSQSSYAFRVIKEEWEEAADDDDVAIPKRTILEAQLYDVSPVTYPAFEGTDVGARAVADFALGSLGAVMGLSEEARDQMFEVMNESTRDELVDMLEQVITTLRSEEDSEADEPSSADGETSPDAEESRSEEEHDESPAAEEAPDDTRTNEVDIEEKAREILARARHKQREFDNRPNPYKGDA